MGSGVVGAGVGKRAQTGFGDGEGNLAASGVVTHGVVGVGTKLRCPIETRECKLSGAVRDGTRQGVSDYVAV